MASIDGSNSSVQDVATRQKIASFPSDLYDPDILSKLTGKGYCFWTEFYTNSRVNYWRFSAS